MASGGTTSTDTPQGYFPFIDGLRAIAVLSVFVYHLNPEWLPGGFTGVDVFFVISGFVISGSLDRRGLGTFTEFVSYFYSRRIKRIMPALLACVLITSIAFVLFSVPGPNTSTDFRDTALSALFGFSNLVLFNTEQGYFAPAAELNPFTHTWSLGVEEQFYLIFPFLFYWWAKDNSAANQRLISASLIGFGLAISLAVACFTSSDKEGFGFYMLPARFWELAFGVLIYQLHASQLAKGLLSDRRFQMLAVVSALMVGLGFVFSDKANFPVPWALLPVLGTTGLIVVLLQSQTSPYTKRIKQFLESRPMVYVGQRSYSMYLWHWPVLVMFRWTVGLEEATTIAAAVTLVLALTIASFNFVERPIRSSRFLRSKSNRVTLLSGFSVTLLLLATTAAVFKAQDRVALSTTVQNEALWYPKNRPVTERQLCGSNFKTQPYEQSVTTRTLRKFTTKCRDGAENTIFSVGDSHAGHYSPIYRTISANRPLNVLVFTAGGCRFPDSLVFPDDYSDRCKKMGLLAKREVLALAQPGDILFLPGNRIGKLGISPPPTNSLVVSLDRMQAELKPFLERGMRVLLETEKPIFYARANRCSDWFNKSNPLCQTGLTTSKALILERGRRFASIYRELAKLEPRVHLWEPMNLLCPDDTCKPVVNNNPIIFDKNHLSWIGNRMLYPEFESKIDSILGAPAI